MENDVLIVVPAKGSSTAIPRKNLAIAAGRPLLWYTLDYIKRIRAVAQSVVVTDDEEIEAFVLDTGEGIRVAREPVVRPANENTILATYRGMVAAAAQGDIFSKVVILQPTQPIRPLNIVERCVNAVYGSADASTSMHAAPHFPEFISTLDEEGIALFGTLRRRQEYAPMFVRNGVCIAYDRGVFQEEPGGMADFHVRRTYRGVVMESFPWVDIDEPTDLELFEMFVKSGKTIW